MSKELALEYLELHRNHCQTTVESGDNTDRQALEELTQAIEWVKGQELLIHSVVVPKGTLPYDPKCDDACKFYCTKGNTQYPECLK